MFVFFWVLAAFSSAMNLIDISGYGSSTIISSIIFISVSVLFGDIIEENFQSDEIEISNEISKKTSDFIRNGFITIFAGVVLSVISLYEFQLYQVEIETAEFFISLALFVVNFFCFVASVVATQGINKKLLVLKIKNVNY